MGLFKDIKSYLTGETDILCPQCGKSNLYLVDNPTELFKDGYCPKCHYILNNKFNPVAGGNSSQPPTPPTPPSPLSLY